MSISCTRLEYLFSLCLSFLLFPFDTAFSHLAAGCMLSVRKTLWFQNNSSLPGTYFRHPALTSAGVGLASESADRCTVVKGVCKVGCVSQNSNQGHITPARAASMRKAACTINPRSDSFHPKSFKPHVKQGCFLLHEGTCQRVSTSVSFPAEL